MQSTRYDSNVKSILEKKSAIQQMQNGAKRRTFVNTMVSIRIFVPELWLYTLEYHLSSFSLLS